MTHLAAITSKALSRLIAVGMAYFAGTALNAALHAPQALSGGYALFALVFIGIAVGIWKVSDR